MDSVETKGAPPTTFIKVMCFLSLQTARGRSVKQLTIAYTRSIILPTDQQIPASYTISVSALQKIKL